MERDDYSPESMALIPISPFSPREKDRLTVFHNISKQIHEERVSLRKKPPIAWGPLNEEGQVSERWMRLDGKFLHIWSEVLESMYSTEFSLDPKMQAAANEIIAAHREQFEGVGEVLSEGEVTDLLNREF